MNKTKHKDLAAETLEELTTFLREGTINEGEIAAKLNFTNLDIEDFNRLKRIHFVLSADIVKFVEKLPQWIRRINRESTREREIGREIEGRINWERTTKLRFSDSYGDRSLFAYKTPQLEYDIPENLVLKKLLWIIYRTITEDIEHIDYSWRTAGERGWEDSQIEEIKSIFERNVHVKRIQQGDKIEVTGRDLDAARQSREELYQEAYELYSRYDRLQRNDISDEIEETLLETLIIPEETYTLFELFAIFKLINSLSEEMQLQPIEPESDKIASLDTDTIEVSVYHDETGDFKFYESMENLDNVESGYLQRYKEVLDTHETKAREFLGTDVDDALFRGVPDIIIEKRSKPAEELDLVLLGEVKYTRSEQTFLQGLKELIEYLKYGQVNGTYLEDVTDLRGLIVTDGVETNNNAGDDDIIHYTTADLRDLDLNWL